MVFAFNTIWAAVIKNGVLLTKEPARFVWDEKRDAWYNRKLDVEIEWLGHVSGSVAYLSSRDFEEVEEWIEANTQLDD